MSIFEKLLKVQSEVKATKDLHNNFGNYNYRSCESILEAVKPILTKHKCSILLNDEISNVEGRFYIKATAEFIDCEAEERSISVSAFAREEESKKGMDGAQITGAASSYARKYALAGLLLLDDNKDPDATNKHGKDNAKKNNEQPENSENNEPFPEVSNKVGSEQINRLTSLTSQLKDSGKSFLTWLKKEYGTDDITALTMQQYVKALTAVSKKLEKEKAE